VQFVNKSRSQWLIISLVAAVLTGCASIDLNAVSGKVNEVLGMSKRAYATRPDVSSPSNPSAPVVIAPPASSNAHASAPDFVSYRVAAAQRIMQINRDSTYTGAIPEPLLAIPVLEISLHRDGSVKSIEVLRTPHFAPETVDMAKAAILRAAPFGSVAHLPQPWVFNETFLYNDHFKFQLHSLQP